MKTKRWLSAAGALFSLAMAFLGIWMALRFGASFSRLDFFSRGLFYLSCTEVPFSVLSAVLFLKKKQRTRYLGIYTVTVLLWIPTLFFGAIFLAFATGLVDLPAQR